VYQLAVFAIIFFAAFTQGVAGFGFGLVAMGLLPLVMPELVAIPFVAVYALCVALLIAWEERRFLRPHRIRPLLFGLAFGAPLGIFFLGVADPKYVRLTLGLFLIAYSLWSLLIAWRLAPRRISGRWGYLAGLGSGVLGTAFNTGGPPLVVYATLKAWDKTVVKSTLNATFAVTGAISVTGHVVAERLDGELFAKNAMMLPAVILGVWLGRRLFGRVDQATFRTILLSLLLIVGVVFVDKSLGLLP